MPRVPLYETQEQLKPLPNVRVRAAPVGDDVGALGAGLQNAAASLGNIALRQQQNENVVAVMRGETALKDSYREFETQARQRKGVNAWNLTADAQEWWRTNANEIAGTLANEEQRSVFRMTADELRQRSLDGFSRFEATERQAAVEDSTKASIAGSIDLAARNPTDMAAVAASRDDVMKRVLMMGRAGGWTPERLEVEAQQTLTELHAQVLENLTDIDPAAAREYFTANKADIAATELDSLEKLLGTGELRAKAQSATDLIVAEGLTEAEALAKARSQYEGDERDEIVRRIKTRYAESDAADAMREREVADSAWKIFSKSGKVESIPSALLDELDGRTLIAMRNAEAGGAVSTDWSLYYQLRQQAANDPAAFAQRDLRQDFPSLAESERRSLISAQETARDPSTLPDAATKVQQIAVALDLLEIDDDKDKGKFTSAVHDGIHAFTKQAGREPTYAEREQIIDRMMMQGEVPGFFNDREMSFYRVVGTKDESGFVPEIPDAERKQIIEALSGGDPPIAATEKNILELYRNMHSLPSIRSTGGYLRDPVDVSEIPDQELEHVRKVLKLNKVEETDESILNAYYTIYVLPNQFEVSELSARELEQSLKALKQANAPATNENILRAYYMIYQRGADSRHGFDKMPPGFSTEE